MLFLIWSVMIYFPDPQQPDDKDIELLNCVQEFCLPPGFFLTEES